MRKAVSTIQLTRETSHTHLTVNDQWDQHAPLPPITVLAVDDEPAILHVISGQLQRNFRVLTACTIEQAKRLVHEHSPDIVLTDLQLPDGNGMDFLGWLQTHAPLASRLLITGTASLEDAADAINCSRIHRLILKPWRGEHLLETINSVARTLTIERSHARLMSQLRRSHLELEERVASRTRELEVANQQLMLKNLILEKMALTDTLTGMPNRRAIELVARKELIRRTRLKHPISIAIVDVDRFKAINSQYLLCGGDHMLNWLGQVLQSSIRATDSIGRVGGEEFMVVAPDTDLEGAEVLAERLRATVAESPAEYQGELVHLTVSVGCAVLNTDEVVTYEQLRSTANMSVNEAKARGRNCCVTTRHIAN
jgi:diguanylate cyclase